MNTLQCLWEQGLCPSRTMVLQTNMETQVYMSVDAEEERAFVV